MNRTSNKNRQPYSQDVESKIQSNSQLQRSRFQGISMQQRPSLSKRAFVLPSNNVNNKNLPQTSLVLPGQGSINKLSSKMNTEFIQNDRSVESKTNKKKNKPYSSRRKILLFTAISLLIILIIVLSIALPLTLTNSKTTSPSTPQDFACVSGGLICSTPIFQWNYYCTPTSYSYYSCCYLSPSSTQLTIEFILEDDISHWSIDDISATQNNGELIINGGFESNLTGWILTIPSNATSVTYVDNQIGASHTGSYYLYGGSHNAPAYLQQTFNVIQGQNINISFWWADGGNSVYIPGKICQATVKMI